MKKEKLEYLSGFVAVLSLSLALIPILKEYSINIRFEKEVLISAFSVIIGFLSGIFSMYFVKIYRHITNDRKVFISYSHLDQEQAKSIAQALEKDGAKVWLDSDQISFGDSISESIENGIQSSNIFIALLSKNSTEYALKEINLAKKYNTKILPIILDDTKIPEAINDTKALDMRDKTVDELRNLIKAIR